MRVKLFLKRKEALGIARRFEENVDGIFIRPDTKDEENVSLNLKGITEIEIDEHHALLRTGDRDRAVIITKLEDVESIDMWMR